MNLEQLVLAVSYPGIFAIVLIETGFLVGFALPGDSLLIAVGLLAAAKKISLPLALLMLFVGSFLGNNLGYWWGMKLGPALERRVKREELEKAYALFRRFGVLAIFIAPWVPVVRALVPFVAGATRIPWPRFVLLTFLACLLWTQGLTLLAYSVGQLIPDLEKYIYLIILAGALFGVLLGLPRLLRRRAAKEPE
ncbi:DedA family protein [Calidithermus roseus]|uniref:Putative membrane protein n=1 Tax=Calidithermus roseus TaxID=1644118 RepID=A0A399EQG9_9DEIN|nr:DedA family protein [Calidithermus roseus]RIH85740.1 putative membrane protein [Calidithermus roseus]